MQFGEDSLARIYPEVFELGLVTQAFPKEGSAYKRTHYRGTSLLSGSGPAWVHVELNITCFATLGPDQCSPKFKVSQLAHKTSSSLSSHFIAHNPSPAFRHPS